MQAQIDNLVKNIVADYRGFCERSKFSNVDRDVAEFANKISVRPGKKYIKIVTDSSVWGFIMKDDDAKFKQGDILKAAGWNAPARNKARGNIFNDYSIAWTGPHYLI